MSPQTFTWHGPAQAVSLHDAAGAVVWEGTLAPGRTVEDLPADHPLVAAWLDQRLLVAGDAAASDTTETSPRRKRGQQEG